MKIVYLVLCLSMLALGLLNYFNLIDSTLFLNLRYDRDGIHNHEYWRLLSGHFVHLNLTHSLMNLAALSLLMLLFWKDMSYKADISNLIFSIFGINIGLYFLNPELISYVGFSGVLHGLFLYYFLKTLPQNTRVSIIAISFMLAKITWEQTPWSDTSETAKLIGGNVATMAHLYGGICGLIAGLCYLFLNKK
jgi:rhomboid family GlyGly-CTERM serine protease